MAWRAETSRRASLAASCEMVSWLSMGRARHSTILGTMNRPLALAGALRSASSLRQGRADHIGAKDVDQRHGVGGRLDAADVQLLELFDVAEDAGQLRAEFFLLGGGQGDARQMRHVLDVEIGGHGMDSMESARQSSSNLRLMRASISARA